MEDATTRSPNPIPRRSPLCFLATPQGHPRANYMIIAPGISSFWGPVTSTTELCEENYAHSSYIAEFYNTISNIPCILFALIGLTNALRQRFEKRFSVLHISNMILAIGSIIFHATLQHVLQQSDETPMDSRYTTLGFVFYVSPGCTSITYKQKMRQLKGWPSSMLPPYFSALYAGCSTGYSARNYHTGILIRRVMRGGMCSWDSTHTLRMHF
ncbi:hypothetical protein OPV22_012345 [Ensete ventricosum]|uniref:Alkaline ceramidase n=1 Tax=Ensete ventricosum TaxID=4639 RepID=A0AAV8PKW8_ENSVE|nr:hypothetical protein OPV22_012345 [Ensete ventricosum]